MQEGSSLCRSLAVLPPTAHKYIQQVGVFIDLKFANPLPAAYNVWWSLAWALVLDQIMNGPIYLLPHK